MACGTITACACVQGFSVAALERLSVDELYERYEELQGMVEFGELPARG